MDVQIVSEKENPLLKRKELVVSLDFEGGPTASKAMLQKLISDQFKTGMDSVEIATIMSEVGSSKGKAWVKIWQEKKIPIYSEIKKGKKEAPKEEPKKEEKPKEEKKE